MTILQSEALCESKSLRTDVIDSRQHSQQESEVGVPSETMSLLGEMAWLVESYIIFKWSFL